MIEYETLKDEVALWTYMPGWRFQVTRERITIVFSVPDVYNKFKMVPGMTAVYYHSNDSLETIRLRVYRHLLDWQKHELSEWFRVDGQPFIEPHSSGTIFSGSADLRGLRDDIFHD